MKTDRLCCYLFIIVAFIGAILVISLPGSDHLENCIQRDPSLSYFQPIGDQYQSLIYKIFHHDDLIILEENIPPQATLITELFDNPASITPINTPFDKITNMLPAWIEFIGHDLFDFRLNSSDPYFGGYRAEHGYDEHNRRSFVNYATPRLDGSHIYGVTENAVASIRLMDGSGKLKTSVNSILPHDNIFMQYNATTNTFLSTDNRVLDGNPLVTALYQLFVREHNYWCDKLIIEHPEYNDDYIYEIAKHIVIGELQAITYQEALPALLKTTSLPYCYAGADHGVQIYSEWALGALPAFVETVTNTTLEMRSPNTNIFLPSTITYPSTASDIWDHGIGSLILGASQQPACYRDPFLYIFDNNINRVQDALLKDYQTIYSQLFNSNPNSHLLQIALDITSDHYNLFLGLLLESKFHSSSMGKLGSWLFVHQFDEIKNHDPYFYTSNPALLKFRQKILHTKLSHIVLRHTFIHSSLLTPHIFLK